MAFQDIINFRESLLSKLLGVSQMDVLNDHPVTVDSVPSGSDPAAEVKRAMNQFKASAMDETGEHVNYGMLAKSSAYRDYHCHYSPQLKQFDPTTLRTREERLAFWINLYNALIIDSVIWFEVKDSVAKDLDIFRFFRRAAYNVGGYRMAAEDIEHGILRSNRGNPYLPGPQFGPLDPRLGWVLDAVDPRIHFALNCASKSCPPVAVYTPEKIHEQLDLATQNFIEHEVQVDHEKEEICLSEIFKWYQADFGGINVMLDFIAQLLPQEQQLEQEFRIRYKPYDWGLNV